MQQVAHRLIPEHIEIRGVRRRTYLAGSIDFPFHSNVTVVVHPPPGVPIDNPAMLDAADARCVALVTHLDGILRSAVAPVFELFKTYFPAVNVDAEELFVGLRLTHVKVMFDQGEELILYGNKHYLDYDLNLRVGPEYSVSEAWFDG